MLRANNVRPYGDAFADGLHEEGYTIALILHSPFSIFNYQFLQTVKEKHRRSSAVLWYDWCVSRVLSWTVIYLECTLPCISSRQSGRSGKPWSRSALLRIEFTGPPCYHGARGALSTLTALCEHKTAVYLCCTIPEVTLGGRYPLSLPCAARTFLIPEGTRPSAPVTVSIITQKTDGRKFFSCYFGLRRIKSRLSTQASASTAGKVSHTPVTPSSALSANSTGGMAMMLRTSEMIKPREACPAALK